MVVTWNSGDKSANITLTGGSLTATTTSATQGAVRATASTAAKVYAEFKATNITGTLWSVGFANATAALGSGLGTDTNSVVHQPQQGPGTAGRTFFNNASLGALTTNLVAGETICLAFDPVAKLFWTRIDGGFWNDSSTADPAAGTGGRSVAAIAAGPYFPIFGDNGSGGALTANFGASVSSYIPPAGFATLDTYTQAYMAAAKMRGYALGGGQLDAMFASKMRGMGLIGAPQTGVSIAKMRGYAITSSQPPPLTRAQRLHYLRM